MAVTRRTCLRLGALGALGLALPGRAPAAEPRARRCILLWLDGGPSHLDTFDPKPGTRGGGPFRAIETAASGVRICEHLPLVAKQARRFTIVRSLHSKEAEHERATLLVHTGAPPQPTLRRPSLGAVVSERVGAWKDPLPPFVSLGASERIDAGFLGLTHEPLRLDDPDQGAAGLVLPDELTREGRLDRRLALVRALDAGLGRRVDPALVEDIGRSRETALRLLTGNAAGAFDLAQESEATRELYGASDFGRSCLLARRLVERGTRFVEVGFDGWDTHEHNFRDLQRKLLPALDRGLSALLEDLAQRGLLGDTLVVCMGEFGRSPEIGGLDGRDHHADVFSAVLAGAGVPGGFVLGASDADGAAPRDRPVGVKDLVATVLAKLGVDPATTYTTPEGRPITLVEGFSPVPELG